VGRATDQAVHLVATAAAQVSIQFSSYGISGEQSEVGADYF
jgi:hypothetical protein